MKSLHLILLLCLPTISYSQWIQNYDIVIVDEGLHIQETSDGNFIACGHTTNDTIYPGDTRDLYIYKIDPFGNVIWDNFFTHYKDAPYTITESSDGGFTIAATHQQLGLNLIKLDANGNTLWSEPFFIYSSTLRHYEDADGNIIIGSNSTSGNKVIKTDNEGNIIWDSYIYGNINTDNDTLWSINYDEFADIKAHILNITNDSNEGTVILANLINSDIPAYPPTIIARLEANGMLDWVKVHNHSPASTGHDIKQTSDGGFIYTGLAHTSTFDFDFFLVKTNDEGLIEWKKSYPGSTSAHSIHQTSDGGYIMGGSYLTAPHIAPFDNDFQVIKTDHNGDTLWTKIIEIPGSISFGHLECTSDGGYIIIGNTFDSFCAEKNIIIIKMDENGNVLSVNENLITDNTNKQLVKIVDYLGRETDIKTQTPLIYMYDDGTAEKKFIVD
jgi:hypothetical protein